MTKCEWCGKLGARVGFECHGCGAAAQPPREPDFHVWDLSLFSRLTMGAATFVMLFVGGITAYREIQNSYNRELSEQQKFDTQVILHQNRLREQQFREEVERLRNLANTIIKQDRR